MRRNFASLPKIPKTGTERNRALLWWIRISRKLLNQVPDAIRLKQYADRTEEIYALWIRQCILFHNERYSAEMGLAEVGAFLTHLAIEGKVDAFI